MVSVTVNKLLYQSHRKNTDISHDDVRSEYTFTVAVSNFFLNLDKSIQLCFSHCNFVMTSETHRRVHPYFCHHLAASLLPDSLLRKTWSSSTNLLMRPWSFPVKPSRGRLIPTFEPWSSLFKPTRPR